jgi:predicted DNA binding CopG/RHH family protein
MKRVAKTREEWADYYDRHGVLGEIIEQPVEFALDEELRKHIATGQRKRRLQNVSIKLDPAHLIALRKVATMKSIPYQTLIRLWLVEAIRRELRFSHR